MLIDDDKDDQELFRDAVQTVAPAISLSMAGDGQEALEYLEKAGLPQLIFLDLNMPRMNGRTFLRIARERDPYKQIPIIIYSTSSNAEEKRITLEMGASYFMVKHYSFDALCEELRSILHKFSA